MDEFCAGWMEMKREAKEFVGREERRVKGEENEGRGREILSWRYTYLTYVPYMGVIT